MKARDLTNLDNNRGDAIEKLIEFCAANDLGYIYGTGEDFIVKLPGSEPLPDIVQPTTTRKSFDIDSWGPTTYHEGEEPDPTRPLDEGEPPKGQIL